MLSCSRRQTSSSSGPGGAGGGAPAAAAASCASTRSCTAATSAGGSPKRIASSSADRQNASPLATNASNVRSGGGASAVAYAACSRWNAAATLVAVELALVAVALALVVVALLLPSAAAECSARRRAALSGCRCSSRRLYARRTSSRLAPSWGWMVFVRGRGAVGRQRCQARNTHSAAAIQLQQQKRPFAVSYNAHLQA